MLLSGLNDIAVFLFLDLKDRYDDDDDDMSNFISNLQQITVSYVK